MYGFISGITDTNDIKNCPFCGEDDLDYHGDGTATCRRCDRRYGVVECESEYVPAEDEEIYS